MRFELSEKCQATFEKLKAFLTKAPILTQPTFGKECVIFSDASLHGLRCVLMQEGKVVTYCDAPISRGPVDNPSTSGISVLGHLASKS